MISFNQYIGLIALAVAFLPPVTCEEIFSVHGSGTTNPSKCFWNIMSKIEEQSHAFTRFTYRAVGSGAGQTEFIGDNGDNGAESEMPKPVNDFGAGDIPLSLSDYDRLKDNGSSTVVHLPFVVSGVSFFHSVPNVPQGKGGLNLTSCLLAQIFNGVIATWDDDQIVEENPNLLAMLGVRGNETFSSYPITVAHRYEGSSSTKSITQYLNLKCSKYWSKSMVNKEGKKINWAPNAQVCDSSGEMTACIRGTEGTIGYIDAGHGWDEGLIEIELQNADNNFVSSLDSFRSGGTAVAATVATKDIESFDESFHTVSLLDQKGENTWPILVMSYIYVRTNIDEYLTEGNQGLLSIFLKAIYDSNYIGKCKDFGFTPVPTDVRQKALVALQTLVKFDVDDWSFEDGIEKIAGQAAKKISPKRRDYGEYERSKLVSDLIHLNDQLARYNELFDNVEKLNDDDIKQSTQIQKLEYDLNDLMGKDAGSNNKVAIVFALISFALWCVALLYVIVTKLVLNM